MSPVTFGSRSQFYFSSEGSSEFSNYLGCLSFSLALISLFALIRTLGILSICEILKRKCLFFIFPFPTERIGLYWVEVLNHSCHNIIVTYLRHYQKALNFINPAQYGFVLGRSIHPQLPQHYCDIFETLLNDVFSFLHAQYTYWKCFVEFCVRCWLLKRVCGYRFCFFLFPRGICCSQEEFVLGSGMF